MTHRDPERRRFLRHCLIGTGGALLGTRATHQLLLMNPAQRPLEVGSRGDAPADLGPWSREAEWYRSDGGQVTCLLCPHACVLGPNDRGDCRARVARDGKLHTLAYGNPCALHVDPMEKKPLFHFLPGTAIFSFATAGCNLHCLNCQNWEISQAGPDQREHADLPPPRLVEEVARRGIPSIAYTYAEPIVFYEYTRDTATLARARGLRNVLVSAGYILPKPLRALCPVIDAANIDLKGFSDDFYKRVTGARLAPVLHALEIMRAEGVWVEITRLVVPQYSDDLADIRAMARWIHRALGPDVPLHLSRFHPSYRLSNLPPTPPALLEEAYQVCRAEGLRHVYVGNVPGLTRQDTVCPACGQTVVRREGFLVRENRLSGGRCPCGEAVAGVWT